MFGNNLAKLIDVPTVRRPEPVERKPDWHYGLQPNIADVIRQACKRHGVNPAEMLGSKTSLAVKAKRDAICRFRVMGFSLPQIGRYMGRMHHTTILHHLREANFAQGEIPYPDESGVWAI